jgi:hypothetical protein
MALFRVLLTGLLAIPVLVIGEPALAQPIQMSSGFVSISDGSLPESHYGGYGDAQGYVPISTPFGSGAYLWIEGVFGERPGNNGPYWATGGFVPGPLTDTGLLFADVQVLGNEDNRLGVDANLGYRFLFDDSFFGIYGGYTRDHSENEYSYNQYGFGLEYGRSLLSLTSNVYLPINDDINPVGTRIATGNAVVQNQVFGFLDRQFAEQHMRGLDFNATVWVPNHEWLYGGVGVYHLRAPDGEDTTGVRLRTGVDLNTVQVDLSVANDDLFGTSSNVGLAWILGRGGFGCDHGCELPITRRLYGRLNKQRRVATQLLETVAFTPFINPDTQRPFRIVYANNSNLDLGDGSLEEPFARLDFANGTNADLIVVQRGTTNPAVQLSAFDGLVLSPYQTVIGDGAPYFIAVPGRGTFLVPGLDVGGPRPFVTANPGAAIIQMASHTVVDGLNLMPASSGFAIKGHNLSDIEIHNINPDVPSAFPTGPGAGIVFSNLTGSALIENVAFHITNKTAYAGISVQNAGVAPLNLTIDNAPFLIGGRAGVSLMGNSSRINATLTDVFADNNGTGLELKTFGPAELNVLVSNSTFTNAGGGPVAAAPGSGIPVPGNPGGINGVGAGVEGTGHGVLLSATSGQIYLDLLDTDASRAGVDGLHATLTNSAFASINLERSLFSNAGRDGVHMSADRSTVDVKLLDVTADAVGRDAVHVDGDMESIVTISIDPPVLTNAGRDAIHLFADNQTSITGLIDGADSQNAGRNALWFGANHTSTVDVLVQDAVFSMSGAHGVFGDVDGNSTATLAMTDTLVNDAAGRGLLVMATTGSGFSGTLTDSEFQRAGQSSLELDLDDATGLLHVERVLGNNAVGSGLVTTAANGATFGIDVRDSQFSQAGASGIDLNVNGSTGLLLVDDTLIDDVGADAFRAVALNASTLNADIEGGSLSNAGDNAYDIAFSGGSVVDLRVSGTPSAGAGNDGLRFTGDTSGVFNANLINSNLSTLADGTGGAGILGTLDNMSIATLRLASSGVGNTGGDGLNVFADNGSSFTGNFIGSSFINAGGEAFSVETDNASVALLNLDTSPGSNAAGSGLVAAADNGSQITATLIDGTLFNNVGGNAIEASAANGSTVDIAGTGVSGSSAGGDGINLSTDAGTINLNLTGPGSFDMAAGDGLSLMQLNSGIITASLDATTFNDAGGDGVVVAATDSQFSVTLADSGLNRAGDDGADLSLDNSNGTFTLDNTDAATAIDDAITVAATNASSLNLNLFNGVSLDDAGGSALDIAADASFVNVLAPNGVSGANAGSDAISLAATTGAGISLTLSNTGSFENAGDDGIEFSAATGSTVTVNVSGVPGTPGSFDNATGDGVVGTLTGGSTGLLTLIDTSFANAGGQGLSITSTGSVVNGTILRNSFSDAGGHAVFLDLTSSIGSLNMTETTMDRAGLDGLHVEARTISSLDVDITNGSVMDAGEDAYDITFLDFSTVDLTVDPTDSTGAAGNGLLFFGDNGSTLLATFIDSPLSSAANPVGLDGVNGFVDNGSTANLSFTRSDIESAGLFGMFLTVVRSSNITTAVNNSSLDNSGANGIDLFANDANGSVTLTNVTLDGVTGTAIKLDSMNTASVTGSLSNVSFDDATGNGLIVTADAATISVTGSTVSGDRSGASAIGVGATNGGTALLSLSNAGSFEDAATAGLTVLSQFAGNVIVDLAGSLATPASFDGSTVGVDVDLVTGGTASVTLTDVSAQDTLGNAFQLSATDAGFVGDILRGDFSRAGNHGFEIAVDNSLATLNLTSSTVNDATVDAFNINATNAADLDMKLTTVTATGAGDDTFDTTLSGGAMVDISIDPNDLSGATDNTFEIDVDGGSALDVELDDTALSTAANPVGNNVIAGTVDNGSSALFDIFNSDLSGAGNDVFQVVTHNGASFTAMLDTVTMDALGGNAFDLVADTGSTISIQGTGASATNTGSDTILLSADAATINFGLTDAGNFTTTGGANVAHLIADNAGTVNFDIVGQVESLFSGGMIAGIQTTIRNNSSAMVNLDNARIANNGAGLGVLADDGSTVTGVISDTVITLNSGGVVLGANDDGTLNDTSLIDLDFLRTNVDSNLGDGFLAVAAFGNDVFGMAQTSGIIVDFTNGTIRFNGNGIAADGVGNGIDASAFGDNSGAENTRTTFNLIGSFLFGNEELDFRKFEILGGKVTP